MPTSKPLDKPSLQPMERPSKQPFSQPTSFPSCTKGKYKSNGCFECPAGTYTPNGGFEGCLSCLDGFFQPNTGQSECMQCPYPYTTKQSKATECTAFCICANSNIGLLVILVLGFSFLVGIVTSGIGLKTDQFGCFCINNKLPRIKEEEVSKKRCLCYCPLLLLDTIIEFIRWQPIAMLTIFGPAALDTVTNILYVMEQKFYSIFFFYLASFFLVQNIVVFIVKLILIGAVPMVPFQAIMIKKFWFLSTSLEFVDNEGNDQSQINKCLPFIKIYETNWFNSCIKKEVDINFFALDLLLLIVIFLAQLVFFIAVVITWPLRLLIMLVIGSILQMCKLITVGKVWNWWFYIWTGEDNFAAPSQQEALTNMSSHVAGRVKRVLAKNKGRVLQGDTVAVIESFNNEEHAICAPCDG